MRVKHLNKGVSGLSTTPCGEMFTPCALLGKKPGPAIPLDYSKGRHSTDQESGDHSAVGKGIEKLSFQD